MERAGNVFKTAQTGAKQLLQKGNGEIVEGAGSGQSAFAASHGEYDVTFGEGRLGFTLLKAADGTGVVCKVHPNSSAANLGVRRGDLVTGINRRKYRSYDKLMSVLPEVPRPVMITFSRPDAPDIPVDPQPPLPEHSTTPSGGSVNAFGWFSQQFDQLTGKKGESDSKKIGANDWKVHSEDLYQRRPGFHGTVVRAFDGVFSWAMYGTSEGSDSNGGDPYIEYVMRCQWGPDSAHMTPWMVARRYREFDALYKDLKEVFPYLKDSFPSLPPKNLFKTSAEVVAKRKVGLEQFMTFMITNFPDVLNSPHINRFLTIDDRLPLIKAQYNQLQLPPSGVAGAVTTQAANTTATADVAAAAYGGSPSAAGYSTGATGCTSRVLTPESAYNLSILPSQKIIQADDLPVIEEVVRKFSFHLLQLPSGCSRPFEQDPSLMSIVDLCEKAWPAVKATAARIEEVDVSLLPRVLALDEALERSFSDLRDLVESIGQSW
ncbi:unnamed protein product [Chrysoparadoxa australica]